MKQHKALVRLQEARERTEGEGREVEEEEDEKEEKANECRGGVMGMREQKRT